MVVYLDDFLIVEESYQQCLEGQHILITLLRDLGFRISWSKVIGPAQELPFLGIVISTIHSTLSLDKEKVAKLKVKLSWFQSKTRASKRQLQSLAGSLNWACQAVRGGRFFLRRVLDSISVLKASSHKCRLSQAFKRDVRWWLSFLDRFNGTLYYRSCGHCVVHTDECNKGAGMFCNGDWSYVNWEKDLPGATSLHINNKEIIAVTLAAKHWAGAWRDSDVLVGTDSTVTKAVINKGTCKNKYVMAALRELFWLSVHYNFRIRAIHIPGVINQMADAISRLHEPGQILYLRSLLKQWHHNVTFDIDWSNHMSPATLQTIKCQLQRWGLWRN